MKKINRPSWLNWLYLFIFILSQDKLTNFSNLSSSLVLIHINEFLDFMSNSKFLHQEFIM